MEILTSGLGLIIMSLFAMVLIFAFLIVTTKRQAKRATHVNRLGRHVKGAHRLRA